MSARSKARKRALDLLFAAEARGASASDLLAEQVAEGELNNPYTATLVEGVVARQATIDEIIGRYAQGWTLDRMPAVDRNVLRLGAWELLFADDVPEHVALSEAIELVRDLSTDESPTYVNGVLGAIQRDKASLV
ncbi:transcription antitermination factor NusB [Nocardioides sp. BP30]|uniref:transcription antitermination factor NusB n=1 Tax=Nocardioides sp. BP30 TaxID=3036374 RepID=UPI002469452A|nr:transcription antitermination factor NusB [Nocardioides sp. BP30]WGL50448.1 transcription antitermination factor NusB [Nocardioides sp. BP30]